MGRLNIIRKERNNPYKPEEVVAVGVSDEDHIAMCRSKTEYPSHLQWLRPLLEDPKYTWWARSTSVPSPPRSTEEINRDWAQAYDRGRDEAGVLSTGEDGSLKGSRVLRF